MATFVKLATATVSSAAQVTFTSIPQTYDDLALFFGVQANSTGYENMINMYFPTQNSVTFQSSEWQDSTSPSVTGSIGTTGLPSWGAINGTSGDSNSYFGSSMFYIADYSSTSLPKAAVGYGGATPSNTTNRGHFAYGGGLWQKPADQVTSLTFYTAYTSPYYFKVGSQIILYGIKRS